MIIDQVKIAGLQAYLKDGLEVNLGQSANHLGETEKISEGLAFDISGVQLLLKSDKLLDLFLRPAGAAKPIISFTVTKELFPEFYADPYRSRIHSVAGFDDMNRGTLKHIRAMEVDGIATLVSIAEECLWISPLYRLNRKTRFTAATWELAVSKLTHIDSFQYSIRLLYWVAGQDPDNDNPSSIPLTKDNANNHIFDPQRLRNRDALGLGDVIAYQLEFSAVINNESYLHETVLSESPASFGQPLLRAIHLIEPVDSPYEVYSLNELNAQSSEFSMLEVEPPQRTLLAYVSLPVFLKERESLRVEVNNGVVEHFEARLDGEQRFRPALTDKQLGG